MNALILLVLSTYHAPQITYGGFLFTTPVYELLVPNWQPADTGMGKCDMDQFYVNSDGLCHRNSDGSAIHILPVPKEVN